MNQKNILYIFRIFFKKKYIISFLIFIVWISIFDQNNLLRREQDKEQLEKLKQKKEYYLTKIEEDAKQLKELKTNKKNLEKFAREQYLMKRENEDIFLIIHKSQ